MRFTRQLPSEGAWRTRIVRAWLPKYFRSTDVDGVRHGTWIWLERYEIEENYQYGSWRYRGSKLL
jgi:hypothetical protein